jgi:hypothetical protein
VASRRLKLAIALGAVAGAGMAGAFGPAVRAAVAKEGARYGAAVEIDQVVPSFRGVRLRGVDITFPELPSIRVRVKEIDIDLGFSSRNVVVHEGAIVALGPRDAVIREVEGWRERQAARRRELSGAEPSENGGRTGTDFIGLTFDWRNHRDAPSEAISARGVNFSRHGDRTAVTAELAAVQFGAASLVANHGKLAVVAQSGGGYRIATLSAASLDATLSLPAPNTAQAQHSSGNTPREPNAGPPSPDSENSPPSSGMERGPMWRQLLLHAARFIDASLERDASVEVDGVHVRLRRGPDSLNLGPGRLGMRRADGRLLVELAPGVARVGTATSREEALTFRLSLPLRPEDAAQEIVADVRGGPIWLSTLGVREGDFGLFDVNQTSILTSSHLVLSADGKRLEIDGDGKLHDLSLRNPALSDIPVSGVELAWRAKGELALDGSHIRIQDGELDLGAIRLVGRGQYERAGGGHRVRAEFEIPLAACQAMLESIPKGLVPKLGGVAMAGSFALKGKTRFDSARIDRDFDLSWDTSNSCRIVDVPPEIRVDRFRQTFVHGAYTADGQRVNIETGPGAPGWVSYRNISRFMETAVLTTEDGGFHRHHGFDEYAIRNSIRENLRKGQFVRGASTISMQLAKNLYLDRVKNLSRKLQEAVLTLYLEQELTKEQLLELYLNVVEFGPMVYGIGAASRHYFNASASSLSLGQALYLSSILPNPRTEHFAAGGAVSPGWTRYLQKLMAIAHKRGRITDEELEEGLGETVVRGVPVPRRAAPHEKPVAPEASDRDEVEPPDGVDWLGP